MTSQLPPPPSPPRKRTFKIIREAILWLGGAFMVAAHLVFAVTVFRMRPGAFTMAFEPPPQGK